METKQMTDEQMQQFVAENIDIVPANQRRRFELYPIDKQVGYYTGCKRDH